MLQKNDIVTLTCIDYDQQGIGIGKVDGLIIFVKGLIKDEIANVKIIKILKNKAYGIIENIIQPSINRIEPICNVSYKCGGCSLMHMNYNEQLAFKTHHVQQCFTNIAKIDIKVESCIGCTDKLYYRNKVAIPLQYKDNKWHYGFYRNNSHDIVEFKTCYIQNDLANKFMSEFISILNKNNITSGFRHVLFKITNLNEKMIVFVVNKSIDTILKQQIISLCQKFNITSIYENIHPKDDNTILTLDNNLLFGNKTIWASCLGLKFEIGVNSFFQVNSKQMEVLYSIAYQLAKLNNNDIILDLYCGTGTIGLCIANKVKTVYGVDIVQSAIDNANYNIKVNNIKNANYICMDAKLAVDKYVKENIYFDTIFVDPPRKGCDGQTIDYLLKLKSKKIIYISCNPATLARDCNLLKDEYEVDKVIPVDMFPYSYHVECVSILRRKDIEK